jgi:HTH-type transcriptional regulator, cell division transcriptional repressor
MLVAMETLGKRIAAARETREMSQSGLARRIGVRPQSISALEGGVSKNSVHLAQIAIELGVNSSWLIHGTGPRYPNGDDSGPAANRLDMSERLIHLSLAITEALRAEHRQGALVLSRGLVEMLESASRSVPTSAAKP